MCVIIEKPEHARISKTILRNSYKTNKHGFGLMYAENGRVHVIKGILPFATTLYLLRKHQNKAYVAHYRYATAGLTNDDNCHPFQVLDKKVHGMDLWLVHNGTLDYEPVDGASDTVQFVKDLRSRIEDGLDILNNEVQLKLANEIAPSKMVMLTDSGKIITLNAHLGVEINNIWYSNMYSIVHPKHPVTLYVDDMLRLGAFHVRDYDDKWKEVYKTWKETN